MFAGSPCNLSQNHFRISDRDIAFKRENVMMTKVWTRPEVKEIRLGCEINSYAAAEI